MVSNVKIDSGLFNPDCPCRSAKNKAKLVIKQKNLIFIQSLERDMSN